MAPWKNPHLWLRRGAFCLLLLAGGLCLAPLVQRARYQHAAVEAIEDHGGIVTYDFERLGWGEPAGPRWLRSWVGNDLFMRVEIVRFFDPRTSDESLAPLRCLRSVKKLHLDGTQVTDAGLAHLERLPELRLVSLKETRVTEEAVARLRERLPHCQIR